jgi:TPR repeat protein
VIVTEQRLAQRSASCSRAIARCVACDQLRVIQDAARAIAFYQKACDGGEMLGCSNLGVFYEQGTGGIRDAAKAAALYQKACDGGSMLGCNNLGAAYE